jgi:nicotinate-nucleotide adenylyltransferase
VANHVFGKPKMCNLAKILYVADKSEPGRSYVNQEYLENLQKMSLNELVQYVLENNIAFLTKKGKSVSENSYKFLESVKKGEF